MFDVLVSFDNLEATAINEWFTSRGMDDWSFDYDYDPNKQEFFGLKFRFSRLQDALLFKLAFGGT